MMQHVLSSMNEVISNNYDSSHKALDIVSGDRKETDIISLEDGTVETVVNNTKGPNHNSKGLATYGNFVKVKQTNGKTALYAHLKYNSIKVNKGQYITKGTVIGTMGETGNAYGRHLHLEIVNENGTKENPIVYLQAPSEEQNEQPEEAKQNSQTPSLKNTETTSTTPQNVEIDSNSNSKISTYQNTNTTTIYLSNQNYKHGSIVDALKQIGINSSYSYRKSLAQKNGIQNYHGSYSQNVKMLNLLKQGKLIKA